MRSPKSVGGTPVPISVYVEEVDAVFGRGPATHIEDAPPEEMNRRAAAES